MDALGELTFGECRLDPVSGQLYRNGQVVPLAPKAFALLEYMARRPGRLISKHELLTALWPGVYVDRCGVEDHRPRSAARAR